MDDTPKRPRGRPKTGAAKRTIRLPADLVALWDAASTDKIRAVLRGGLPAASPDQ